MLLLSLAALALSSLMSLAMAEVIAPSVSPQPSPQRQQELVRFVRQECGFCHGLHLTGGLGSPLTKAAMAAKPAETLEAVILHGIPGTAMPGWRPFISEPEVQWIVRALQEGFPYERK